MRRTNAGHHPSCTRRPLRDLAVAVVCALLVLSSASAATAACGDGVIDGPDICDDMNTTPGDGCSASCQVEANWGCTSQPPSRCYLLSPVSLPANQDSFLLLSNPNRNEGANEILVVKRAGSGRAVVGFDTSATQLETLSSAKLVLTIDQNGGGWGAAGRTLQVFTLGSSFFEGNGRSVRSTGVRTRGTGEGVTWRCSNDDTIDDKATNCPQTWGGGELDAALIDSVVIQDSDTGEISFDITDAIRAGKREFLVRKADENTNGRVFFVSREGAAVASDTSLAPRLDLVGCVFNNEGVETCNGLDDDCDGLVDADDPDLQTPLCENQVGVCTGSFKTADLCVGGTWSACGGAAYSDWSGAYESTETACDDLDNDCDHTTDEGCPGFDCDAAGGTSVVGQQGCWFLGGYGQNCDAVCGGKSLVYSNLTREVAGSNGTSATCTATLSALGATVPAKCDGTPTAAVAPDASGTGVGCIAQDRVLVKNTICNADPANTDRYLWFHVYSPETKSWAAFSHMQRACACRPAFVM